jgi:hypothetical protein
MKGLVVLLFLICFCISLGDSKLDSAWNRFKIRSRLKQENGSTRVKIPSSDHIVSQNAFNPSNSIDSQSVQVSMKTINLLNLFFYGTLGSVMPYLPLLYRKLGVSDTRIGILGAITPAITFIVSPLWSALADATGLLLFIIVKCCFHFPFSLFQVCIN